MPFLKMLLTAFLTTWQAAVRERCVNTRRAEAYLTVRRALAIERNEVVAHLSPAFAVRW